LQFELLLLAGNLSCKLASAPGGAAAIGFDRLKDGAKTSAHELMKSCAKNFTIFTALLILLTGCQSGGFSHCVSPQISGRVLAADTHQPLAGASVSRITPQVFPNNDPPKGGQVLMQKSGVQTDAEGRFVLASEHVFAIFRQPGWWSVPVNFSCAGYESFQKNYTGTNVTSRSEAGVPVVDAGDVLLKPLAR
jgi:hypothetical protein